MGSSGAGGASGDGGSGRLRGKTAVVLGASGRDNIGQAIVRRFVGEGAAVIAAGRRQDELELLAGATGCRTCACNITDPEAVDRLFAGAGTAVDVAVNTTGRNLMRPFMETTPQDVEDLSRAHLLGPLLFIQSAVRAMRNGGSIIHMSSVSARIVMLDHVAYTMTKAASEVLVKAAAFEFGARGVRVNAIAPALTYTPMTREFFADEALVEASRRSTPLRRLGTVDDVADAAVWLASDHCFMTGETLQINGGVAMHTLPIG